MGYLDGTKIVRYQIDNLIDGIHRKAKHEHIFILFSGLGVISASDTQLWGYVGFINISIVSVAEISV